MLFLISGGSASGKSAFAETVSQKLYQKRREGRLYYLATMDLYDEESRKRAARHRQLRQGKGFETIEQAWGIGSLRLRMGKGDVLLLEDLSNLLANQEYLGKDTAPHETILQDIFALEQKIYALVVVSNEIFSDGILYPEETQRYVERLALLNRRLGKQAAGIAELVFTVPVFHKGKELFEGLLKEGNDRYFAKGER